MNQYALSGIGTWYLTVCHYLNLKHGKLDHLATTAGLIHPCAFEQ